MSPQVIHRETGKVMVLKELIRCDVTAQKQFIKEVSLLICSKQLFFYFDCKSTVHFSGYFTKNS